MSKSLGIITTAALVANCACAQVQHEESTAMLAPRKAVILDLHGVVLDKNFSFTKACTAALRKKGWLRNMSREQVTELLKLLRHRVMNGPVSDDSLVAIAKKYDNEALAELVVEIVNARGVNPVVVERIKTLQRMGFELIIGSDIGQTAYEALAQQEEFAAVKRCFSGVAGTTVSDAMQPTDTVMKSSATYFDRLLAANSLRKDVDLIVFVDDNAKIVAAARDAGLKAIQFDNPDQLDTELGEALGIVNQIADAQTA